MVIFYKITLATPRVLHHDAIIKKPTNLSRGAQIVKMHTDGHKRLSCKLVEVSM